MDALSYNPRQHHQVYEPHHDPIRSLRAFARSRMLYIVDHPGNHAVLSMKYQTLPLLSIKLQALSTDIELKIKKYFQKNEKKTAILIKYEKR